MKNLETGKLYVKEIFDKSRFYQVPDYQRPYVWGTQQIVELLNDLSDAMEADSEKEYFLGCMIWNNVESRQDGYRFDCQDILDGQQRFLTLYLLHSVIRDLSTSKDLKQKVQERLMQREDKFDDIPARNRVLFSIRKDKSFIDEWILNEQTDRLEKEKELSSISNDDSKSVSIKSMANAVIDMYHWWDQRFSEFGEDTKKEQEYLTKFFRYLSNKVLALFLATPDNLDDAYNLFTVLNSRGVQLRAGDILKAQNLRHIQDEAVRKELTSQWDEQVDAVCEPLDSFDELLKYIMLARIRFTSDKTRTLGAGFEYLFKRDDVTQGEGFFKLVSKYSEHFSKLSNPETMDLPADSVTEFENLYFILSSTMGSQFLMPLMHYRERFGDGRIFDFLIKLDNLMSMAWLLGKRTLQQRSFILIRKMDEYATGNGDIDERAEKFLRDPALTYEFKYQTSKTDMYISEFRDLLESELWGAFGGSRLNKPRYILLKLDMLFGNKNTKLSFNRSISSIEHLVPRKPIEELSDAEKIIHEEWVHRIGNLVLLDRKKNSSLSNQNFSRKREKFHGSFETRPYTNSIFMNNYDWTTSDIQKQQEKIIDLLCNYYYRNCPDGVDEARSFAGKLFSQA